MYALKILTGGRLLVLLKQDRL